MQQGRLQGLDALRAFAALAIVFSHTVLLGGFPMPQGVTRWANISTLGVQLFFALSAFSLAYGYEGKLRSATDVREYALRRFLRIAPLFYFMMAVWLVYRGIKLGQPPSPNQVFLNAAFLFGFSPAHYQSLVPAGWSLGVEMIFYAVLPVLFVIVRDVRTAAVATAAALVLGFAFFQLIDPASSFQRLNFVSNLANFTGGLTAYFIYKRLAERPAQSRMRWSLSCLGIAGAIWLAAYVQPGLFGAPGSFGWRYFISAAFPPLILAVALYPWAVVVNRVTVCLGLLSYSTYLWHPFVITVLAPLRRRLYSIFPGEVWLPLLLTLALVASIAIAVSFLTYQFIERPALRLSFGTRKSAPVAAE